MSEGRGPCVRSAGGAVSRCTKTSESRLAAAPGFGAWELGPLARFVRKLSKDSIFAEEGFPGLEIRTSESRSRSAPSVGLALGGSGLGFRVKDSGVRVQVQGMEFGVKGSRFRVECLGFKV